LPAGKAIDAALLRAWPLPLPNGGDKNSRGSDVLAERIGFGFLAASCSPRSRP
jgi:hypothetical protein